MNNEERNDFKPAKLDKNECLDCKYIGSDGYWNGVVEFSDGSIINFEGKVMDYGDGTFDIQPLLDKYGISHMEETLDIVKEEGEVCCPKCKSDLYWRWD